MTDGAYGSYRSYWSHSSVGAAALLLLTLAAYAPALRAGFVWDDQAITANPLLRSWAGLARIWAHPWSIPRESHAWPLVYSVFWLEVHLWGLRAAGYHLVNVLLHAANAILVWRLLNINAECGMRNAESISSFSIQHSSLINIPHSAFRISWPWFAGALFALHPVHVESVAWAIELKDVLSGLLYLLAFMAYLRFDRTRDRLFYLLTLFLYMAALLSKSVAVTLPVGLAIWIWWQRGRIGWREWVPLLGLLAAGAVLAAVDLAMQPAPGPADKHLALVTRFLIAARAPWFYLGKLCWPAGLIAIYPFWNADAHSLTAWIFPALGFGTLAALWAARGRIGRGPLAAALFFLVTLAPTLGLVEFDFMRHAWAADRFQYLASIAPLALAAMAMRNAECGMRNRDKMQNAKCKMQKESAFSIHHSAFIILFVLAALTFRQAGFYRDMETLFGRTLALNPRAWVAHADLGYMQIQRGDKAAARREFEAAIAINPDCEIALGNLGVLLAQEGRLRQAAEYFKRALTANPNYAEALVGMGNLELLAGRPDAAIAQYRRALALDASSAEAHYNLSLALTRKGLKEEAAREQRTAAALAGEAGK